MSPLRLNKEKVIDFALHQLDLIGYELQSRGISDQVNRHNLAALAMTKQQQLKGEMARYELKVAIQKRKLEKARLQASDTLDSIISYLPAPLATPVTRMKSYVL